MSSTAPSPAPGPDSATSRWRARLRGATRGLLAAGALIAASCTGGPWLPANSLPATTHHAAAAPNGAAAPDDAPASELDAASGEPLPADLPEIARTDSGLLDVHVRGMPLPLLLESLSYEARTNIVASTSVGGTISANLYGVTLDQALEAVLTPNNYAFRRTDGTIFVGKAEEMAALRPPPVTRVFELKYLSPTDASAAAKSILGMDANVVEGGGDPARATGGGQSGSTAMGLSGTSYVIVTDQPDRVDRVAELLAMLDQRPRQVLIEATILRATLTENNQFGVDFTMLCGVDFQNVTSASNAGADLTTGKLPVDQFQDTTVNLNTAFNSNLATGGFRFGIINNGVAAFVQALEQVTNVVVVANPKIIALNKQEGEVIVGRRDGYITTTVTETIATQKVEFLETGTQIRFRPLINADQTVRLVVHPKDSNGGLSAANLPFEETTEAHADVIVEDGKTILIGGLFRERTVNSRSQVPVFGDIPLAGLLTGSRNDQTVREEVIILLTVHVLKDTPAEAALFRELASDVERIRVGARMGLLGTGRERLAQAFYHEAVHDLETGHRELALLNLRMTLTNHPVHLPALRLIEQLEEQRLWDEEGQRMRAFIWELMDAGRPDAACAGVNALGRPTPPVILPPQTDTPPPDPLLEAAPQPAESGTLEATPEVAPEPAPSGEPQIEPNAEPQPASGSEPQPASEVAP